MHFWSVFAVWLGFTSVAQAEEAPTVDLSSMDVQEPPPSPVPPTAEAEAPRSPAEPAAGPTADTVQEWLSSVVLLITGPAYCSGVVIDEAGTVATAYHCIANGNRSEVHTRDGTVVMGKVLAAHAKDDLALLSVPDLAGKVAPLPIHASAPRQGDHVWGLGHPFAPSANRTRAMSGMLLWSVTEGIVSAVGPRLIQTDAALNPGNSGGPVVDENGHIIGIASRKLSGDNIAFLASADRLRALVDARTKARLLGGQLDLGLGYTLGTGTEMAGSTLVNVHAVLRDHVVVGASAALGQGARGLAFERGQGEALSLEGTVAARIRAGRGAWSMAFDVGGGAFLFQGYTADFNVETAQWTVLPSVPRLAPAPFFRFSTGGIGLRWVVLPNVDGGFTTPDLLLSLDLHVPGTVFTF